MLDSESLHRVEYISYSPSLQNTGDLEAATKTITRTTEASGTGSADYSAALTIGTPSDARLAIVNVASRLSFTIDSFTGATILYCRVYVDSQDANHLLFDTSHNAASNKLAANDTNASTKAVIFALLKNGSAHTFYFFFWVNQATNAVISVVQLWEAVGSVADGGAGLPVIGLTYTGWVKWLGLTNILGSGTTAPSIMRSVGSFNQYDRLAVTQSVGDGVSMALYAVLSAPYFVDGTWALRFAEGSVTTDIDYIGAIGLLLLGFV